uniref:Putative secreted protein n=1 Tax=Anopheles marajoara TaxID=58244 RepID=A0A2M4CCY6_9DIPT
MFEQCWQKIILLLLFCNARKSSSVLVTRTGSATAKHLNFPALFFFRLKNHSLTDVKPVGQLWFDCLFSIVWTRY